MHAGTMQTRLARRRGCATKAAISLASSGQPALVEARRRRTEGGTRVFARRHVPYTALLHGPDLASPARSEAPRPPAPLYPPSGGRAPRGQPSALAAAPPGSAPGPGGSGARGKACRRLACGRTGRPKGSRDTAGSVAGMPQRDTAPRARETSRVRPWPAMKLPARHRPARMASAGSGKLRCQLQA